MKKILFFCLTAALFAQSPANNRAEVHSYQGVNIYIESVPVTPYRELGRLLMHTDSITCLLAYYQAKKMIEMAKEKYPTCNGIIFDNMNMHKATVIKFK